MAKFRYQKRAFLSPVETGHTSFILAEVESSEDGSYKNGNYMITLADCRRRIELEFFLGTARDRPRSLAKIDLLLEVFTAFRAAIQKEARLIANGQGAHTAQKQ